MQKLSGASPNHETKPHAFLWQVSKKLIRKSQIANHKLQSIAINKSTNQQIKELTYFL